MKIKFKNMHDVYYKVQTHNVLTFGYKKYEGDETSKN